MTGAAAPGGWGGPPECGRAAPDGGAAGPPATRASGPARGRWPCQPAAAGRAAPLPVVALPAGARTLRGPGAARLGQPGPGRLAGDHLDPKGRAWRSRGARPQQATAVPVARRWDSLGPGRPAAARAALQTAVGPPTAQPREAFVPAIEPPQAERIAAGRRQRAGQPLGRGRLDTGVEQGSGARQQPPGRRWSPTGRTALGRLQGVARTQPWEPLGFPQQAAA